MYKKISDYGVIGNLRTVALIGLDGSIDWLCLPFLDSPSVFGSLLDDKKGGRFHIRPADEYDSTARYREGTNILVTSMRTRTGVMRLTDFMPPEEGREVHEDTPVDLYRFLEVTEGSVEADVLLEPMFDYARKSASVSDGRGCVSAASGDELLALASTRHLETDGSRASARLSLKEGESAWFLLSWGTAEASIEPERADVLLRETVTYWRKWLATQETGRNFELGPYRTIVDRSALLLKLLLYAPTGAIAAAATTSLPEVVGGERNWDYRYTWVRDTSFTIQALFDLGHLSETENYLDWMDGLMKKGSGVDGMKIMYGLRGEEDLEETELHHLDGYKGSRPVRIGNGAAEQVQLDIYGELMDASLKLSDYVGKIDANAWSFLREVCGIVVRRWQEPDAGIWEVRGGPYHFVYSKLMCWVALDRGITIAKRYGFQADLGLWKKTASAIRREVLSKGWSPAKGAFRQHYDTEALDASSLLVSAMGFLPPDDPRVASNVEAVARELGDEGFIYRYTSPDGLSGSEGTFLLCTLWYIDALIALGRLEEAEAILNSTEAVSNHLGLFPEQYGVRWQEALGNFPQAFTHIGYINSVMKLLRARSVESARSVDSARPEKSLPPGPHVMNDGPSPSFKAGPRELSLRLKSAMNVLRGAFFDTARGRIAYEQMRGSEPYQEYLRLSYALKDMDLDSLVSHEDKLAFWINLYNVAVIHGVIEFGVRDSVKEVRRFYRRAVYNVGGMEFSLSDMEHGVLRGNRRPPGVVFRPFRQGDPRLRHVIRKPEPRVHFALVCASSSCPPIAVYTAEGIDRELDIAATTFVNSGGVVLDREDSLVSLSTVFKWYARDFGGTREARLRFLSGFMYDKQAGQYLAENARSLKVRYQQYDWRLNRS